jgi:hypothetical protein
MINETYMRKDPLTENFHAIGALKVSSWSNKASCRSHCVWFLVALQVDAARKFLNTFWKGIRKDYLACKLQLEGEDFFSPERRWFGLGTRYWELVEPLDTANWYKAEIHKQVGKGHYIGILAFAIGLSTTDF